MEAFIVALRDRTSGVRESGSPFVITQEKLFNAVFFCTRGNAIGATSSLGCFTHRGGGSL